MLKNVLKALREEAGLSLREAGRYAGIHYEYISLFERMEKFPDKKQLKALEKLYGTDLKEYFQGVKMTMLLKKAKQLEIEAFKVCACTPEDLWRK